MKRGISLLIVIVISFSIMNAETFHGSCGQKLTWSLNTEDSTLIIQGEGAMENWNSGGAPWYAYEKRSCVVHLYLPDKLTSIGDCAFEICQNLRNVTMPTGVKNIGHHAFRDCTNLSNIVLSDSLTSIGERAFSQCEHLSLIKIPDNVVTIGKGAFESCVALKKVFLPQHISLIEACTFGGCCSLTEVTIPNEVTAIGSEAFGGCSKLPSIIIPNSVTKIEYSAFTSCSGLLSIFLGSNLKLIGERAFSGCKQISSVTCYAIEPPIMKSEMEGDKVFGKLDCTNIPLYVPAGSEEAYKVAEQWKEFHLISPIKPTSIDQNNNHEQQIINKRIHNGQLYLLCDGKIYTIQGQEVR